MYTDSETGRTYPLGPSDFDSQRNLRFFDPEQKQEDMQKWQEYKEQYDRDHPETEQETDDYSGGGEPQGDEHHDFADVGFNKPPPVPGGADGNGAGKITVNTEALKKFGQNLDQLVEPMLTAKNNLARIDIAPGGLPASWRLMDKIQKGGDSLVPSLQAFIAKTHGALDATKAGVEEMCRQYTNTEELNTATAKDLGPFMYESKGFVESLGQNDSGDDGGETGGDGSSGESDDGESDS